MPVKPSTLLFGCLDASGTLWHSFQNVDVMPVKPSALLFGCFGASGTLGCVRTRLHFVGSAVAGAYSGR